MITKDGQRVHIATVDLRLAELRIIRPAKKILLTTSHQARLHDALIAINGGFFDSDGSPVGALKIEGTWISKPHPQKMRGVIGFDKRHGVVFDRLIYKNGIITNDDLTFAKKLWWDDVENILGGAPLLLYDGKKLDLKPEKTLSSFLTERYARTAICADSDDIVKLVVVDGGDRKANAIAKPRGMTLEELAEFLLSIGCKSALNLDGGYSSTYVAFQEKISRFAISTMPERDVATVIIVKSKSE
jgi:exopolysaccharide biosynthesis protein